MLHSEAGAMAMLCWAFISIVSVCLIIIGAFLSFLDSDSIESQDRDNGEDSARAESSGPVPIPISSLFTGPTASDDDDDDDDDSKDDLWEFPSPGGRHSRKVRNRVKASCGLSGGRRM